jgi:hypothetical protein
MLEPTDEMPELACLALMGASMLGLSLLRRF